MSLHKRLLFVKGLTEKEQNIRKNCCVLKLKVWIYG